MDTSTVGWFPVFTLLLGYITKSVTDWLQHRRTLLREREAREAEKHDQAFERRVNFQQQTLLDLQDAVMRLMRTCGAMHHQDVMAYKKTGQWQKQLFGEDLSENNRLVLARTTMLEVRVREAAIRDLVRTLKEQAANTVISTSFDASELAANRMLAVFEELNQRIGEVLRELDQKA